MISIIVDAHQSKQNLTIAKPLTLIVLSHQARGFSRLLVWLCLCLMLVLHNAISVAQVVPADDDTLSLSDGETRTVELNPERMVELSYRAESPQWVQITTRALPSDDADALTPDTVLLVRDSGNNLLTYVDDTVRMPTDAPDESPTADDSTSDTPLIDTNASIRALYLPRADTYTVLVDSFNGVSVGAVDVRLMVIDPFAVTETSTEGITELRLHLPRAVPFEYTLTIPAGATLDLSARDLSSTLDPLLFVYDAVDSRLLAQNDDHGTDDLTLNTLDARLVYSAPVADAMTVRIVVRDFLQRSGELALRWTIIAP